MAKEDTIFDKIVRGEIPVHKIYEDLNTLAFLDIAPVSEGHILLIPKTHYSYVWDLPPQESAKLFAAAHLLADFLREKTGTLVSLLINGEEVEYAHIHLVPHVNESFMTGIGNIKKYKLEDFGGAEKLVEKYRYS